jgi:Cd2+/Zn2+-exporting ATPase/Cu+-exporting ATPase
MIMDSTATQDAHHDVAGEDDFHLEWTEIVRILFVFLAAAAVWLHLWEPFSAFSLIGIVAALIGGYPIYHEAFESMLERRMTMELSMTIAIAAALVIGEYVTALVIIAFVLIAEILEELTVGRGRKAIHDLLNLLPAVASVKRNGRIEELRAEELRPGDMIVVKPGSRISVDGIVRGGHSFVDQSAITGESLPVEKIHGAAVFAGTINQSGALEIEARGIGRDTAFGKIIAAVEEAERSRAPIQRIADRLAGYLVYFALGCAALTFLFTRDARSTISVVIVAGACGIAAGTPLAILGGIGLAARNGAIIKGGRYLEALWSAKTVVLDKTGTLTFGNPEVTAIHPASGVTATNLMEAAVTGERLSEHPIGKAVLARGATMTLTPRDPEGFRYFPGKGIRCNVNGDEIVLGSRAFLEELSIPVAPRSNGATGSSDVFIAQNKQFLGSLEIADTLRPEAVEATAELSKMGLRTVLLTGDHASVGKAVAERLAVDEFASELLPEQKMQRIQELMKRDGNVIMVGDGINDAPALMQATAGVAMGSGTDVARETASVVLLGNNLMDFVAALKIARRVHRTILVNFVGTLAVDGLGVLLAALGFLNPLFAAFIHVSSELVFILNSARLLPSTRTGQAPREVSP